MFSQILHNLVESLDREVKGDYTVSLHIVGR